VKDIKILATAIRQNALRMVHQSNASHIRSALSIADIVAVLYERVLNTDPENPGLATRDRFILSKGHACVAVYAALYEIGMLTKDEIASYAQDFSDLMAHISHKVRGVEFSTGSLGHGLPFAVGKAFAAMKSRLNWRVFVLVGDGELDEGANWEALMFASHNKVINLCVIIDCNNLQSLDTVENTLSIEPLFEKLVSFGCNVMDVDGHNHDDLIKALLTTSEDKPIVIIARTIKGKGISFMENQVAWHYKNPNDEDLKKALLELEG
jgi:transketolase